MARYLIKLQWDGSDFAGWQSGGSGRCVVSCLQAALERGGLAVHHIDGAARTDAGVHARGQLALLELDQDRGPCQLHRLLEQQLPEDCACPAIAVLPEKWQLNQAISGKTYRYRITRSRQPFKRRFTWRPPFHQRLDSALLSELASSIPGHRDWRGFSRRGESRDDLCRSIDSVHWQEVDEELHCLIRGSGFVYRLARSLIGAQLACAAGICSREDLQRALAGEANPAGRQQAPARGLCLEAVHLKEPLPWQP